MTLTIELNGVKLAVVALGFSYVVFGTAKALGWVSSKSERQMPPIGIVLIGLSVVVLSLGGSLRNEAGEQVFELGAFLIYVTFLMAGVVIGRRARPDSAKEESMQLIADFERMYGKRASAASSSSQHGSRSELMSD